MLFAVDMGMQLPDQKCIESPFHESSGRRLHSIMEEDGGALARQAEEACSHLKDSDLFDSCYFDVLVTGDTSFAEEPWYN